MHTNHVRGTEATLAPIHGRLQDVIQRGFPEVGWKGDVHLELTLDRKRDEWVVYDTLPDPPQPILRKKTEGLRDLDFRSICTRLREADTADIGGATIVDRIQKRNDLLTEQSQKPNVEVSREVAERMAFAIRGSRLH